MAEAEPVEELLARMRRGDREAAALFMERFGPRIRRRIRGRLGPAMRRLFDSQEIMSTLGRRLDLFVRGGKLTAASQGQLWSLVLTMAERAVVDKARVFARLKAAESGDEPAARALLDSMEQAEGFQEDGALIELDRVFAYISDKTDREILSLWLQDTPHHVTADLVGLSPAAVRKRWENLKKKLQPMLSSQAGHG